MTSTVAVVTEPEYLRAHAVFEAETRLRCVRAPADEAGLVAAIRSAGARHAIVGHLPYRDALYAALARGTVLARFGVGHENIDKIKATEAGLLCTNTPGVLDQSVAELTMALITAAARRLTATDRDLHAGVWAQRAGIELAGKTLAIIGSGRIGAAVARIAAGGFGMRVVGFRRSAMSPGAPGAEWFTAVTDDFAHAVAGADFVSLLIPASPETVRFLNRERLALVPAGAWIVNTARGAVLDEVALYDELANGRLGGAALDVFEREPYEPADPARDLRRLPNVILTPHVGSHTAEANRRMAERALRNVAFGEAGRLSEMDLLNPSVLDARRD